MVRLTLAADRLTRAGDRLTRAGERAAGALLRVLALGLIVAVALNFINVIGRYLLGITFLGADEIEVYILIFIAFLGGAIVTWRNQHLKMDVLIKAAPPAVRNAAHAAELLTLLAVATFVAIESFRYAAKIFSLGALSDIAHIPTWIPHSAVPLGFTLIALITAARCIAWLAGKRNEPQP